MNLDKLAKQLRRDVAANPKKAGILGVMALVALYFWGPLVWGWMGVSEGEGKKKEELAHLILTDDPVEHAGKAKAGHKPRFRWEKVRPLLATDPRMESATFDEVWIDPFGRSAQFLVAGAESAAGDAANPEGGAAASSTPAEHGLTLTSVAIGARRAATINGERYFVGDEITTGSKDATTPSLTFRLTKITSQGVELQGQNRLILLPLQRSRLAGGDRIERSAGSGDR